MKTRMMCLLVTLLCGDSLAHASVRDEIAQLEAHKTPSTVPQIENIPSPVKAPKTAKIIRLSSGASVNLNDFNIVLFMQQSCSYCKQFDPVLRGVSESTGLKVFPYTLDGQGDESYPNALPAPPEVVVSFFQELPVATPTAFLVNVHTMQTYPLFQGVMTLEQVMARLDEVLVIAQRPQ
ncbi:type-F conjugative transfer system pilin assembly thiol-disulfide isomerase TrbB [Yersinia enterocolitica]|uniref:type-F conjugative transfer system pilin assembly thiol-disulfide isomerase TrbB n=1 Tax=Yersinia enterocolitica TaxID=630 RepID=UPI00289E9513|nr:type-F conjugative transfer system pilin assembly thiol-disulfide isomerase TrbB [Yersinia enterocolitica]